MNARDLTPDERAQLREVASVFEADLRVSLQGKEVTPANLKAALLETYMTLSPPGPEFIIERDPDDPNRIVILTPLPPR